MFDRYQIPYPTHRMTWEELFELAARFLIEEGPERIYGLQRPVYKYQDFISYTVRNEHMVFFHPMGWELEMNTKRWQDLFGMILESYMKGAIYTGMNDFFLAGQAAMFSNRADYIDQLQRNDVDFEWSIVTDIVYSGNRNLSAYVTSGDLISIHKDSARAELAWDILKFLNSDEIARV